MSIEHPITLSQEQIADIEQSRQKNERQLKSDAASRNNDRSLTDKLRGKNEVSYIDIAHEDALKENEDFDDKKEKSDKERLDINQEIAKLQKAFEEEMQLAQQGKWHTIKSAFIGSHEYSRHSNSLTASYAQDEFGAKEKEQELRRLNTEVLKHHFDQEMEQVNTLSWKKEASFFQSEDPFGYQGKLQWEHDKRVNEDRRERVLKLFTSFSLQYATERQSITNGTWNKETSKLCNFDSQKIIRLDSTLASRWEEYVKQLKKYESEMISEKLEEEIKIHRDKEFEMARGGTWNKETSFFATIQSTERFKKATSGTQQTIIEILLHLTMERPFANRDSGNGNGRETKNTSTIDEKQLIELLSIAKGMSLEDVEKKRKVWIMKNHPDRSDLDRKSPEYEKVTKSFGDTNSAIDTLMKRIKNNGGIL